MTQGTSDQQPALDLALYREWVTSLGAVPVEIGFQDLEQANLHLDLLARQHARIARELGCDNKTSQILRAVRELKAALEAERKRSDDCDLRWARALENLETAGWPCGIDELPLKYVELGRELIAARAKADALRSELAEERNRLEKLQSSKGGTPPC